MPDKVHNYTVHEVADDTMTLQSMLNDISRLGGKVIQIFFKEPTSASAHYLVIAEYKDDPSHRLPPDDDEY